MLQLPRGTKDLFGKNLQKIQHLISVFKQYAANCGYQEIITPTFEYATTFINNNVDQDIANKELFVLKNEKYVLKPENTASVARSIITNNLLNTEPRPLSYFYCSKIFRYERPQKGRYREFLQFGFEKIDASSWANDVEMIVMINQILKNFDISLNLKLNFLSSYETKKKWNSELTKYFEKFHDSLSEESQKRIYTNPLRILDDKEDSKKSFVKDAPKIQEFLSQDEINDIKSIQDSLKKLNISYSWDDSLVRGIDYYTGLVYEWQYKHLTIVGGGRYDNLFFKFNDQKIPSLGCAVGIERMVEMLDEQSYYWPLPQQKIIYFAIMDQDPNEKTINLMNLLRMQNLTVVGNWDVKNLKNHFRYSEKISSDYLLIYGPKEAAENQIIFKKQKSQKQFILSFLDLNSVVEKVVEVVKSDEELNK